MTRLLHCFSVIYFTLIVKSLYNRLQSLLPTDEKGRIIIKTLKFCLKFCQIFTEKILQNDVKNIFKKIILSVITKGPLLFML